MIQRNSEYRKENEINPREKWARKLPLINANEYNQANNVLNDIKIFLNEILMFASCSNNELKK